MALLQTKILPRLIYVETTELGYGSMVLWFEVGNINMMSIIVFWWVNKRNTLMVRSLPKGNSLSKTCWWRRWTRSFFFEDFSKLNYLTSLRLEKNVGDSTVQDICALRYNPSDFIEFNITHPEEWQILPIRINKSPETFTLTLYNKRLKISKDKYEQSFYDSLPYDPYG